MHFKTRELRVNGDPWRLRELSAGAIEAIDDSQSDYSQALTMLALSLCDDAGSPLYTRETLAEGQAFVRELPAALVRDHLIPAATALNSPSLDDARGN